MSQDKTYRCRIIKPHVLALAIDQAFPQQATSYAVNIGAHDGVSYNDPVYPLFQMGFAGLAIEGGDNEALVRNLSSPAVTVLTSTLVDPTNIVTILQDAQCPRTSGFFKIDIDGYDGPLLKAVLEAGYRPKVLQLEVNPEFPPPIEFAVHYHPDYRAIDDAGRFSGFYGASLAYMCKVAQPYKYRCVYLDFVSDWTHDVTLVHEDYFEIAIAVLGEDIRTKTLREFYLEHPPGYSHFAEYGIDSSAWRYRTDVHVLLNEIWTSCMHANIRKHGHASVPFHLAC